MYKTNILVLILILISCEISTIKSNSNKKLNFKKKHPLNTKKDTTKILKKDSTLTIKNNLSKRLIKTLPSGVKIIWTKKTKAPRISKGEVVRIKHTQRLTNGKVLETWKQIGEAPTIFTDYGMLVKGVEEGFYQLGNGEKAKIYVPSSLAYGEKGLGKLIPPNSDIIFEVEIVDILQPEILQDSIKLWIVGRTQKTKPNTKNKKENITFHYLAYEQGKGMFDNSIRNRKAYVYNYNNNKNTNFLKTALSKIRERDKAYVQIPAKIANNKKGLNNKKLPNKNIMYDILLLKIN